jgi:uncharacterized repeat protein (TIGR02543 family)
MKTFVTFKNTLVFLFLFSLLMGCQKDSNVELNIEIVPGKSGTVNLNPGGGDYPEGTTVALDPVSSPGYIFVGWGGQDKSMITDNNIIMSKDMNIIANFNIGETHEFGTTSSVWYIYSDGKSFDFIAEKNMQVKTVEVKTWLATNIRAIFHIEVIVSNAMVAKWDQPVNMDTTFKEYINSIETSFSLKPGDKIIVKINGNSFWDPEGGLRGVNYVRFLGV